MDVTDIFSIYLDKDNDGDDIWEKLAYEDYYEYNNIYTMGSSAGSNCIQIITEKILGSPISLKFSGSDKIHKLGIKDENDIKNLCIKAMSWEMCFGMIPFTFNMKKLALSKKIGRASLPEEKKVVHNNTDGVLKKNRKGDQVLKQQQQRKKTRDKTGHRTSNIAHSTILKPHSSKNPTSEQKDAKDKNRGKHDNVNKNPNRNKKKARNLNIRNATTEDQENTSRYFNVSTQGNRCPALMHSDCISIPEHSSGYFISRKNYNGETLVSWSSENCKLNVGQKIDSPNPSYGVYQWEGNKPITLQHSRKVIFGSRLGPFFKKEYAPLFHMLQLSVESERSKVFPLLTYESKLNINQKDTRTPDGFGSETDVYLYMMGNMTERTANSIQTEHEERKMRHENTTKEIIETNFGLDTDKMTYYDPMQARYVTKKESVPLTGRIALVPVGWVYGKPVHSVSSIDYNVLLKNIEEHTYLAYGFSKDMANSMKISQGKENIDRGINSAVKTVMLKTSMFVSEMLFLLHTDEIKKLYIGVEDGAGHPRKNSGEKFTLSDLFVMEEESIQNTVVSNGARVEILWDFYEEEEKEDKHNNENQEKYV